MGILDRVRNMFTEEVDEPVTKEENVDTNEQIELEEEQKEETLLPKKEEKPMPIFFDDQDFATLEKPRIKEEKKEAEEKPYVKKVDVPEKKAFKLSPVISPVYGVLDKNYHKEDITPKRPTSKVTYYDRENMTIEEVRKKAYGTLEDELETTLLSKKEDDEVIGSRMQRKYRNGIMLDELMDMEKEVAKEELDADSKTLEPIALDNFLLADEGEMEEDYKDPLDDTLTESDLFHLIDSMYDKEEE